MITSFLLVSLVGTIALTLAVVMDAIGGSAK